MTDKTDIYCFDDFVLNPGHRELKQHGEMVEIEPRAFDVLTFLVQNRDRAVDKDELQEAIWPGVIVTETALTRAVMKARKAIGDDASRQEKIKTLHGHGYRFVAKLTPADGTVPGEPGEIKAVPHVESARLKKTVKSGWKLRWLIVVSIVAVLITSMAWVLLQPQAALEGETRIAVMPLQDKTDNQDLAWTSFGLMSYASKLISNDGSMLVVPAGSIINLAENLGWTGDLEDPANEDLLAKLRQVFGATYILAMELETEGLALRMNYSLLDADGKHRRGTIVGDDGTELAKGVVQAVYGILFRKSRVGSDIHLVSEDSFNNEAFARGMDLSLQGRCNEAAQFFRVIIEQEPELFAPRFEYAACLRILGEPAEAEALLKTLIEEQRPLGFSKRLAQSLMTLGIVYNRTGHLDLAQQAHDEALQISTEIGDHVLSARILQNLSIVYRSRSELDEAGRLLDLAVLAYQDAGIESLPGHLYSGRANLKMSRGELMQAEAELESALHAFRDIGDRRNEAMMLNNTGYLRRLQGRLEEAEAYHLRSLEIRQEIGDKVGVGRIYGMLSGVYSGLGRYEDAIKAAESAREIARETNDRLFEATSLSQLAAAENAIGQLGLARMHYHEGRTIFVEIQDKLRTLQSDLALARLDLKENRVEQAQATTVEILETSVEQSIMTTEVEAMELLGDIEASRNNNDAAISYFTGALERVRETSWGSKENTVTTKLANVYMDESDQGATAPLIGALASQQENTQSLKAQARFAYMRGDADKASRLMSRAKAMAGRNWAIESEATLKKYQDASTN